MEKVGLWQRIGLPDVARNAISRVGLILIGSLLLGGVEIGDITFPNLLWPHAALTGPIAGVLLLLGFVPFMKCNGAPGDTVAKPAIANEDVTTFLVSRASKVVKDLDLITTRLRTLGSVLRQREGKAQAADDATQLAGKLNELRLRFHQLHWEHVDAAQKGNGILAREIDKGIQRLITTDAKPLFNSVVEDESGAKLCLIDYALSFRQELDSEIAAHINDLRD